MKKKLIKAVSIIMASLMVLNGCSAGKNTDKSADKKTGTLTKKEADVKSSDSGTNGKKDSDEKAESYKFINPEGTVLKTRINPPEGYERTREKKGSLGRFIRNYKMKPDKSPVLLYNGKKTWNQDAHAAVFKLLVENVDLQQCADSIMRVYAEYFRSRGEEDRILFHFTNGFPASYSKWKQGYRISVSGNTVSWVKSASPDDSEETFIKYLHTVFSYAGTASMETECRKIKLKDIRIGDVFLYTGSPGHVLMVVDTAVNPDGEKAFLLAQGFMPAQEFHVLKNHGDDPWYYFDDIYYSKKNKEYSIGNEILERPEY